MEESQTVRVIRGKEDWREIVNRHRESGLSGGAFCDREGLTRSLFYKWQRHFRGEGKEKAARFVELSKAPRESNWRVELDLGSGIILRLRD